MYVKVTNGAVNQFPYTIGQLRRDNPNVSFPKQIPTETLAVFDVFPVVREDLPEYNERTQNVVSAEQPELVNGSWVLSHSVEDKSAEEIQEHHDAMAQKNREDRNKLLAETDHFALSDNTLTTEMATYRQALRDLTSHVNWPFLNDSDLPVKP